MVSFFRFPFLLLCLLPALSPAQWAWQEPRPQGNAIYGVAFSPETNTRVAVGKFGACLRKAGDSAWEAIPGFSDGRTLESIVWANDRFLAVGSTAGLWTSPDGAAWSPGPAEVAGFQIAGETGRLAILSGNDVWVSSDAQNWTRRPLPLPSGSGAHFRALGFQNGAFVAVGEQGVATRSTDGGLTWSQEITGVPSHLFSLAASNGVFVAAGWYFLEQGGYLLEQGGYQAQVIASADGQLWTQGTIPTPIPTPPSGNYFFPVLPSASGFLAQGNAGFYSSEDGLQWDAVEAATVNFSPLAATPDGPSNTLVVGNRGGIFSVDAAGAWTSQTTASLSGEFLWPPKFFAAALGNLVLAKDDDAMRSKFYRSEDAGATWSQQSQLSPFLWLMSGLQKIGGRIVGYTDGDSSQNPPREAGVYETTDGIDWHLVAPAAIPWAEDTNSWWVNALAANDSESVAVALTTELSLGEQSNAIFTRKLYRSKSWGEWVSVNLAALRQLPPPSESGFVETVFWDGKQFVLLLYPGRIFTSTNGSSWVALPTLPKDTPAVLEAFSPAGAPAENSACSVASDGELLVARSEKLDASGNPGAWSNGQTRFFAYQNRKWRESSIPTSSSSPDLTQVLWDGAAFLSPVPGGLLASSDAQTWTRFETGASLPLLLQTDSNLVGFTDETAVLTHPLGTTSVAPSDHVAEAQGETFDAQIASTNFSWKSSSQVPWISVSPSSGAGNASLGVSVQPNKTSSARSGTVRIGNASLLVTQPPVRPFAPKNIVGKGAASTIPFSGNWTAHSDQPWATFQTTGTADASGSGPVKILFAANTSPSSRTVSVTINGLVYSFTQAGNAPPTSFQGAAGTLREILPLIATPVPNQPLAPHFQSVEGSLSLAISSPTAASPDGAYSAVLNLFHNGAHSIFRARGHMGPGRTLSNVSWSTTGKNPQTVTVSLAPLDNGPGGEGLEGTLTIGDTTHELLLGKQIYDRKTNPWPADESWFTMALPDGNDAFAGTASGSASISNTGIAKIAARLGDGTAVTLSVPVWGATGAASEKILFLSAPLAKNLGFLGGWVARQEPGPGPWQGRASWSMPAFPAPHALEARMSPYSKPPARTPAVSWPNQAQLSIINPNFISLDGTASISPANKLSVIPNNGNTTISLTLNASTGVVSGSCKYYPVTGLPTRQSTAKIYAALDQPSASIHGTVVFPDGKTGILEVLPQ
jgi:hypothetical protein